VVREVKLDNGSLTEITQTRIQWR